MLAKMVQTNQRNWDVQLPKALFAYRCSLHESTGFTPYHLNFGRSPHLPVDVMLGRSPLANRKTGVKTYPDFIRSVPFMTNSDSPLIWHVPIFKNRLTVREINTLISMISIFCVWLYTPAVRQGQTRKLASLWRGPYTIVDKCGSCDYRIQLIGGTQSQVVHRDRLKLYHGTPPPTPKPEQLFISNLKALSLLVLVVLVVMFLFQRHPTMCLSQPHRPLLVYPPHPPVPNVTEVHQTNMVPTYHTECFSQGCEQTERGVM